jgi:hypothetical protein
MRLALPLLFLVAATPALAQTDPGTMQRHDTFRDAATAPLEDLNLKQTSIPPVLQRAVADPYDMTGLSRCEPIAGEVGRLDAALGPDLDEIPPPDDRSRGKKVADAAYGVGVAGVRDTTQDVLPFRGWIRKLTGAARHDKAVRKAIAAGGIRRGYLKGVGMRMNCAPPAAPSWFVPVVVKPPPPPKAPSLLENVLAWWDGVLAWFKNLIG